jgi:hypothetical protein
VLDIPAVRMLLITFLTSPVIIGSTSFLVQYASDKYHWLIADVRPIHIPRLVDRETNVCYRPASSHHSAR